jgi:RNA binding exosome subunit
MFHVYTPHQEKLPVSEDMLTIEELEEQIEENNAFLRVARTKRRIDDFTRCAVRLEKQLLLAKRRAFS